MMCWLWVMVLRSRDFGRGEGDGEGRALAGALALGGHLAAVHVDNTLDDGQPKPGRALAGGRLCRQPLEPAEQAAEILRRQAGALVADADDGVAAFMAHDDADLAADRRVFDGVADEVVDRLADAVGVAHGDDVDGCGDADRLLLVDGEGWLASATSLTRAATSTGSRRMVMSKASAIASE